MTNEQAAMLAAASYLGPVDAPGMCHARASSTLKAQRISALAKELLKVLDQGTLVAPQLHD